MIMGIDAASGSTIYSDVFNTARPHAIHLYDAETSISYNGKRDSNHYIHSIFHAFSVENFGLVMFYLSIFLFFFALVNT